MTPLEHASSARLRRLLLVTLLLTPVVWSLHAAYSQVASPDGSCPPVQNTPRFTIVYGAVTINGSAAPSGTTVEAVSPRGDTVGCFLVESDGSYGAMYVYGEYTDVEPSVPGMRSGEEVTFYVEGREANPSPTLLWSDDHDLHQVDLAASGPTRVPTNTGTPTFTGTPTTTGTATGTATDTPVPTSQATTSATTTATTAATATETAIPTPTATTASDDTPTETPTVAPTATRETEPRHPLFLPLLRSAGAKE